MNTKLRILLALALFAGIVAVGVSGTAWADKLNVGAGAPVSSAQGAGQSIDSRPAGTVQTNPHIFKIPVRQKVTVGSCTTVSISSAPANVRYTASVVSSSALHMDLPGKLVSCVVKIVATPATASIGTDVQVCFPVGPTQAAYAYFYDGSNWNKTTVALKDSQSCVTVPAKTGSPVFSALFDR